MGYPSENDELAIIRRRKSDDPMSLITPKAGKDEILFIRAAAESVTVSEQVLEYIVALVRQTRTIPELSLGASPRASLALMRLSRAMAVINGRDYVVPSDVSALFIDAVAHRVILSREARGKGLTPEDVLKDVLSKTKVPFIETKK